MHQCNQNFQKPNWFSLNNSSRTNDYDKKFPQIHQQYQVSNSQAELCYCQTHIPKCNIVCFENDLILSSIHFIPLPLVGTVKVIKNLCKPICRIPLIIYFTRSSYCSSACINPFIRFYLNFFSLISQHSTLNVKLSPTKDNWNDAIIS